MVSPMVNPIVSKVNGTLTCEVFPRERGRYEVVCSLVKPTGEVTFASHGVFPGKEAAIQRAKEVVTWMKKNPARKTRLIDRYINLERRLELCKSRSAENKILFELSRLEAIEGITTDDVRARKQELRRPWKEKNPRRRRNPIRKNSLVGLAIISLGIWLIARSQK